MAFNANEFAAQGSNLGPRDRTNATSIQPKTFAAGSGTLALMTMVTFNTSTNKWQVFQGQTDEINTITSDGTPATAGDFTITVNGQETADIVFDATAAIIQTALELLSTVASGDLTAVATTGVDLGDASAVVTLNWAGLLAGQNVVITIDVTGLTGNDHVLATPTAGGADAANGTAELKGFVWPEEIVLDASDEILGNVMMAGVMHRDDVPLVTGSYGQIEIDQALREDARGINIHVQGIDQVR